MADALEWENKSSRCETLAQFPVELSRILSHTQRPAAFRFVLVFDAIDRQREAPPTLLPALARLADIVRPGKEGEEYPKATDQPRHRSPA